MHSFERRKFLTAQLAAWENTASLTKTGRPFDAILLPVAPYSSFAHETTQDCYYTVRRFLSSLSPGTLLTYPPRARKIR